MHHDENGWPCVVKFIGLLIDNGNDPIFYTPDKINANASLGEFINKVNQLMNVKLIGEFNSYINIYHET